MLYYMFDLQPFLWRQDAPHRQTDRQTDRQHYRNQDSWVQLTQSHQARYARSLVYLTNADCPLLSACCCGSGKEWTPNTVYELRRLGKSCICSYRIIADRALVSLLVWSGWAPQVVSTCTQCGPKVLGLIFFKSKTRAFLFNSK